MNKLHVLLGAVLMFFLVGCLGARPVIPPECANSLIYPIKTEWTLGAGIFKIGVLEVVKRHPELKQPTLDVLEGLADMLALPDAQYTGFAYVVLQNVEKLNLYVSGASLLVASDLISELFVQTPLKIDPCDRDLLLRDVSQLRVLVGGI